MRRIGFVVVALLVCRGALAADLLKPGPGSDTTEATCVGCHTPAYIVMNSRFLTQDGWKAEVTKMRVAYGAPIEDATAAEIIAYLAQNYAAPAKP